MFIGAPSSCLIVRYRLRFSRILGLIFHCRVEMFRRSYALKGLTLSSKREGRGTAHCELVRLYA